jgi:DNA invertase Pin-like site-specific DNA recombinase
VPKSPPRRAYSYVRFSTPQQAEGGSLARQTRLTREYCDRKKLVLDDTLCLNDFGTSAFRGDNVRQGALAGFIEACRTGRVPRGSYLVVESLDRLSRDQIRPALQLFLQLQEYGIRIVTHEPAREYDPDAADALTLIEPLIVFARAHEESVIKSHRRRDGWKQARDRARQGGGPVMKTCPAWLEATPDGFRGRAEAAAAVRRVFDLARDGLGVHRIAERLTREGVPPIGTGERWVKAYVYRILTNPAATGAYQPCRQEGKRAVPEGDPIPGYFPAVVTEEEWRDAQAAIEGRGRGRGAGRKGSQESNLFTGLAVCAQTGERMHLVHARGNECKGERKRYVYLCPTQETGAPGGGRFDYPTFEASVLSELKELRPADIVGDGSHVNGREAEIARLSGRLLDIDNRLERARERARTADDFDAFLDLIQGLQAERKEVSERLAGLRQEEESSKPSADLGEAQSLISLLAQAPDDQREDLRRRLKARIRQLVTEIRVLVVRRGRDRLCVAQLWFRAGGRRRDILIYHKAGWSSWSHGEKAQWWVRSFADVAAPGDLDLRKAAHVKRLEKVLAAFDPRDVAG